MALDAVRFRWSQMPLWLQGIGVFLLVGSFYILYLTFRENPYLSPAVRVQTERGQTAVSTGPYRKLRHPMYAAFVLFAISTALLLGSWSRIRFVIFRGQNHFHSRSERSQINVPRCRGPWGERWFAASRHRPPSLLATNV